MAGFGEYVYSEGASTHRGEAMYDCMCSASSSRVRQRGTAVLGDITCPSLELTIARMQIDGATN